MTHSLLTEHSYGKLTKKRVSCPIKNGDCLRLCESLPEGTAGLKTIGKPAETGDRPRKIDIQWDLKPISSP